jgi:hypothetical protein
MLLAPTNVLSQVLKFGDYSGHDLKLAIIIRVIKAGVSSRPAWPTCRRHFEIKADIKYD